jgi:hypothetical protein
MESQPQDRLASGSKLHFATNDSRVILALPPAKKPDGSIVPAADLPVHRWSLNQVASRADVPIRFIDALSGDGEWGRELLAHNLNEIYTKRLNRNRFLIRSLNQEVRGFLSDAYRRIDSRPLVAAFFEEAQSKGLLPYQGYVTDTKIEVHCIMPEVFEPYPGEVIAFGTAFSNSDYGNGAASLRDYVLRIWCANLAVFEEAMRHVHLGKRLDDNILYSERTQLLDAETTVSALRDIMATRMTMDSLRERVAVVQRAATTEVKPEAAKAMLKKLLNQGEAEAVQEIYTSLDTDNVPAGNTMWRLSNAISWVAGRTEDAERKLELARAAGTLLQPAGLVQ